MYKHLFVLFCLILNLNKITCTFTDILEKFLEDRDGKVVRVCTTEERDRRSGEFAVLDFIGLVEQHSGYTAEGYQVLTPDGYVLVAHRISGSPYSSAAHGKPVVLMQHGLFQSADFFVALGPQQALAFQLADAGYDVWLGNIRGNTYSNGHVNYTSVTMDNERFWDFSMDEIATIDLPTFIDAILEKTNQEKLTYIGYSMGNTLSYILLSEKPEYNNKIKLVVSIAPIAYFTRPLSQRLESLTNLIIPSIKSFYFHHKMYQVLHQSKFIQTVGKDLCYYAGSPCQLFFQGVTNHLDYTKLPTLLAHTPAGGSLKTLDHYHQMITSGKFQKYKPGILDPIEKFNGTTEAYDLTKISSPQALFYSDADVLASSKGVEKLKSQLSNVVTSVKKPKTYNHLDFIWANNAEKGFNHHVIEVVQSFS